MIVLVIASVLLLLAYLAFTLEKVYFYLPPKELQHQAPHDAVAGRLYGAAAYAAELKLLLSGEAIVGVAAGLTIVAMTLPPVIGFVIITLALLFFFGWLPHSEVADLAIRVTLWLTPTVTWKLRTLHPVLQWLARLAAHYQAPGSTGLYDREDMLALLDRQARQPDSRLGDQELTLMRRALQFGDFTVADVLVPESKVKAVGVEDVISPVFLAELHAGGHPIFPVYEGLRSNIIGTLAVDNIADVKQHGRVGDSFSHQVAYLHERDSLPRALRAFYETHQHLFIVVNKQGDYVGIVTLGDILHHLFGAIEHEAFGHYDDRRAVAKRHS